MGRDLIHAFSDAGLPAGWIEAYEVLLMPFEFQHKPTNSEDASCFVKLIEEVPGDDAVFVTWTGMGASRRGMLVAPYEQAFKVNICYPLEQHLALHFQSKAKPGFLQLEWNEKALLFRHGDPGQSGVAVDLFAGIGGWSFGRDYIKPFVATGAPKPFFGIEAHRYTAELAARLLGWEFMSGESFCALPWQCIDAKDEIMIFTKVNDLAVLSRLTVRNLICLVGSPSCQPWSATACRDGLACELGTNITDTAVALRVCQPPYAAIENVNGMLSHPQWPLVQQVFAWAGYRVAHVDRSDIRTVRPMSRKRFAIFLVREDLQVDPMTLMKMSAVAFPSVGSKPTFASTSVIMPALTEADQSNLKVPADEISRLLNPRFLPSWEKGRLGTDAEAIKKFRVLSTNGQLPALMASYRTNITFTDAFLQEHGLHAFVYQDKGLVRYFHSAELAAMLGFPAHTMPVFQNEYVYRACGNCLSPIHASQVWFKLMILWSDTAPYEVIKGSFHQVCKHAEKHYARWGPAEPDQDNWTPITPTVAFSYSPLEILKRRKIGPHVFETSNAEHAKWTILESAKPCELIQQCLATELARAPATASDNVWNEVARECVVRLSQIDGQWAWIGNVCSGETVANVLDRALPGVPTSCCEVQANGNVISTNQAIHECQAFTVSFQRKIIQCRIGGNRQTLDVTVSPYHTASDVIALIGPAVGVSTQCVKLQCGLSMLDSDRLVWPFAERPFVLRIVPIKGGCDAGAEIKKGSQHIEASSSEGIMQCPLSYQATGSSRVREGLFPCGMTLAEVVRGHPEWPQAVSHAEVRCQIVPLTTTVAQCHDIVTFVAAISHDRDIIESPTVLHDATCELWFHCPLQGKLCVQAFPENTTLNEVIQWHQGWPQHGVSAYVNGNCLPLSRTVMMCEGPVAFRVFPLLGGGKGKAKGKGADRKNHLSQMLVQKGVAPEVADERADSILSRLGTDAYDKIKRDESFWANLKAEASKHGTRLVFPNELKQFQSKKRSESRASAVPKDVSTAASESGSNSADGSSSSLSSREVSLPTDAFQAQGVTVPNLAVEAFCADACGICIMHPCQARNFLPPKRMSADGLAIITTGPLSDWPVSPVQYTARNQTGGIVLLQGHLLQYGDHDVAYVPQCPSLKVQEIKSTTLEIIVERASKQWGSAVHDYVTCVAKAHKDVNCTEGVLSKWRFKVYDAKRRLCRHDSERAQHLHGFLRVRDDHLMPFLAMSGKDHMFVSVRSDSGRHDKRFSVIPAVGKTYEEAQATAQTCSSALGIVKLRDAYGIRCKREHWRRLKRELNPEVILSDSDSDDHTEAQSYRLCNVRMQTTKQALTTALKAHGWQATVTRSVGTFTWLVRASNPPQHYELMINGHPAVVVADKSNKKGSVPVSHASAPAVGGVENAVGPIAKGPTTTRIEQLQSSLQDQIAQMVDARMQEAAGKIQAIEHEVRSQHETVEGMKRHLDENTAQVHVLGEKIEGVQSEVHVANAQLMENFKSFMTQFKTDSNAQMRELHDKLDGMQVDGVGDPDKRRRVSPAPEKKA